MNHYKRFSKINVLKKMSCYFIDLEGYYDDAGMIIPKEMCIMNVNDILNPKHMVFNDLPSFKLLSWSTQSRNQSLMCKNIYLTWLEGDEYFCPTCINEDMKINVNSTFYVFDKVNGDKISFLKRCFPNWKFKLYSLPVIHYFPNYIICPWRNHGPTCAYKHCLIGSLEYLKHVFRSI